MLIMMRRKIVSLMRIDALLESREAVSGYGLRSLSRSCSLILSSASVMYRCGSGFGIDMIFFSFSRNTVSHGWKSSPCSVRIGSTYLL